MAEELQRIGELRYQQGEITLLEKNMMTTIAADLHNRWFQAKEEEKMALARFQWSCYSNDPIVPVDSTLSLFYTGISDGNLSGAHTAYFQSQADEAKAMLRVEQSHFFPEISVGYTRQGIPHLLPATKEQSEAGTANCHFSANTGRCQHPGVKK